MKEQLISFETAKLAKEKGFDLPCFYYYDLDDEKLCTNICNIKTGYSIPIENKENGSYKKEKYYYAKISSGLKSHNLKEKTLNALDDGLDSEILYADAPTQSLLQKWLREKHLISVDVMSNNLNEKLNFTVRYYDFKRLKIEIIGNYTNYEQALEKGLQESLKLV